MLASGVTPEKQDPKAARLGFVASPVPKCEGPGAPSFVVWKDQGTGATSLKPCPCYKTCMKCASNGFFTRL